VLFYSPGSTTATGVYGKGGSFTTNTANNGGISAGSLAFPFGVAIDSTGDLYVTEYLNNRVLKYNNNGPAAEQIDNLTTTINNFNLSPAGIAKSFISQLQAAATGLLANDTSGACTSVNDLIHHLNAQSGKKLTTAQAQQLLASANTLKTSLGCP
jgi:hypothetical protein